MVEGKSLKARVLLDGQGSPGQKQASDSSCPLLFPCSPHGGHLASSLLLKHSRLIVRDEALNDDFVNLFTKAN